MNSNTQRNTDSTATSLTTGTLRTVPQSATTGGIVYKIIRSDNSGQGVQYSNNYSGQFALVVTVEEEEDKCLFLAIVVKETKPDTWIRLGWVKIRTKE
jgi:hypothetical protein